MDSDQIKHELRPLYPRQPISLFMQILRRVGLENPERLKEELGAAERQILRCLERQQKKEDRRAKVAIKALLTRLEIHRKLQLDIDLPVSLEYVQVILVYGFAKFGSRVVYAKRHKLKVNSVRQNVMRKLEQVGVAIDYDAISKTLSFLISQGVVNVDASKNGALSLNFDDHGSKVMAKGKLIIKEMKRLFHHLFKQ